MASLTGNKIKDTYQSLLKTADNGQVTSVSKNITDGFGSGSGLYLKDTGVTLSGSVALSGITSASQTNVLTYDTASGQIYYTASSAISTPPSLQQVTTAGSSSSDNVTVRSLSIPTLLSTITLTGSASPNTLIFTSSIGSRPNIFGVGSMSATGLGVFNSTTPFGFNISGVATSNRNLTLPDETGTLVLKVNGISADSSGSITLPTGSFLTTGSLSTTQQLSGSLNITGSLNFFSGSQQQLQIQNGILILSQVSASLDFANDAAAAAGGVPLGGLYRNGNAISIRIV